MYTPSYSSSSPIRTSTSGIAPSSYHDRSPSRSIQNNYYKNEEATTSIRRSNAAYGNPTSYLASTPLGRPANDLDGNRYQSVPYRSYAGEGDIYRSHSSAGNIRTSSSNDIYNERYESSRFPTSYQNVSQRTSINNHQHGYAEQNHPRRNNDDDDLVVKSTDLSATNEREMMELVRLAFQKYDLSNQRELAGFLKRSADKTFSSCWHCIVGRQFSSYVTHEMNGFIYLTKGPLSILLFKSGS